MDNNDPNNVFSNRESDKIPIRINGKEYLISTFFSLSDAELYLSQLEETQNSKRAIAFIVHKKLKKLEPPIPTVEEIANEDASVFSKYILAIVKGDGEELYNFYEETEPTLPDTERFAQAYKKYSDLLSAKMAERLKPTLETLKQIQKSVDLSWINQLQQTFSSPVWVQTMQQVSRMAQDAANILAPIRNAINEYATAAAELISNIQIPSFSDEDKERLAERYRKWGDFGWTIIPNAPIKLFNSIPQNIEDAHKYALKYCTPKDIESLFASMKEKNIRKAELDEAIYCYEHKQYTSCALLLFALIDAKMIRKQPKQEGKRRPVGGTAARELKKRFADKHDVNTMFFLLFDYINLMACLDIFFKNGEDFKQEPAVINRNFVGHGMHSRKVRKRDCIQLFLVLYNLTDFLEAL
jgi:uncharacterized protein YukE